MDEYNYRKKVNKIKRGMFNKKTIFGQLIFYIFIFIFIFLGFTSKRALPLGIFGLLFLGIFVYIWIDFFIKIFAKPKKKVLYLDHKEDDFYVFYDENGKKYFYEVCNKKEKKYYYVYKIMDSIYDVGDECLDISYHLKNKEEEKIIVEKKSPLPMLYVLLTICVILILFCDIFIVRIISLVISLIILIPLIYNLLIKYKKIEETDEDNKLVIIILGIVYVFLLLIMLLIYFLLNKNKIVLIISGFITFEFGIEFFFINNGDIQQFIHDILGMIVGLVIIIGLSICIYIFSNTYEINNSALYISTTPFYAVGFAIFLYGFVDIIKNKRIQKIKKSNENKNGKE